MSILSDWKEIFQKLNLPKQRRYERSKETGLAAEFGLDSSFTSAEIKDMSASGIYLITEKRLSTNELITLILREKSEPANSTELKFSVDVRVIRQGEDGIGLSFVLPPGLDTEVWEIMVRKIVTLTNPKEIAKMFRTLRVILLLCRLCQSGAEEAILLLGGELLEGRVETLVKIALAAENMLASEPDFERRRAHPKLVANILREGSWAPDELTVQLWAGLLVSSCQLDESDDTNQKFVDLLVHISPVPARIFIYACEQALRSASGTENCPSSSVLVTPEELAGISGVSEITRNSANVDHLFDLGLIRTPPYRSSFSSPEEFDIAPTSLGLELYKHCHGTHGKA
jgi:hypothetical protein